MNLVSIETAAEQLLVASGLTKLDGNSHNNSLSFIGSQLTSDSFQHKAQRTGGLPDQMPAECGLGRLLDES
jgi:hypothetical protein